MCSRHRFVLLQVLSRYWVSASAAFRYVRAKALTDHGTCKDWSMSLFSVVGHRMLPMRRPVHEKIFVHDVTMKMKMCFLAMLSMNLSLTPRWFQSGPAQKSMDSSTSTQLPGAAFSAIHFSISGRSRKSPVGLLGFTRQSSAASLALSVSARPAFLAARWYSRYCTSTCGLMQKEPSGAARPKRSMSSLAPLPKRRRGMTSSALSAPRMKVAVPRSSSSSTRIG
mmetsp:Transcript_49561/g.127955  ORF Transcript_49561/g.127955 Transcript_49561/m.127955 type:complete len:224 (+) Transcript_49561:871-1542(+)